MPAVRTEITEIVTGLATLGHADPGAALRTRPGELAGVGDAVWQRLAGAYERGEQASLFAAAWANGRAFLHARDGLRGRTPLLVEWKGNQRAPGDAPVPADLRLDHVWLVSCKYLSRLLANRSPWALFGTDAGADYFAAAAPEDFQALYGEVRALLGPDRSQLPPAASDLNRDHRRLLSDRLRPGWPSPTAEAAYADLCGAVSRRAADHWKEALPSPRQRERELWRLLRMSEAPYFVLGVSGGRTLRLRVMTPWDWRQRYSLRRFDVWADDAGQPQVRWRATVGLVGGGGEVAVDGHVEIRWSHGRFGAPPEAKVYLDTPHHRVPGYVPLT